MCGATSGQKQIAAKQSGLLDQATQQAQAIFGNSSSVFKDLMATFAPIVQAGPSQEGFSAAEKANLKSQAITETGQAYNNAKQAVGERIAAQGGGNMALPSGAAIGPQLQLASSAAEETSRELSTINAKDYETGRENYKEAVRGMSGAPNVFAPATSSMNAATGSGEAAANTENQIAQENNSWVTAVTGALGGIAGGVISGGMSNLGKGAGFFGGKA